MPLPIFAPGGFLFNVGQAVNDLSKGNVGEAAGDFLGFDPTPGFRVTPPVANASPSRTTATPSNGLAVNFNPGPGDGTTYTGGGGYATGYSAPNYAQLNAGAISQLQQGADSIQNSLNRLPTQLQIAQANINGQYGQKNNELDSGLNQTTNQYNTSTTTNQQGLRSNKNSINDQASQGLRGLMRMLGAYGAVGSDMGQAGRAVSGLQSQQNAGAGQTYSQNQSSLDTNFGNYKNQFDNEKKKLTDWMHQNLDSAQSQSLSTKQSLLAKLADIQGQIGAARGGSYSGSAQPYLDQANSLSGQIDNLGKLNPTYTGTTPVYNAPTLDSYRASNPASIGMSGNGTSASATPFLDLLLGKNDKNKQPGQI